MKEQEKNLNRVARASWIADNVVYYTSIISSSLLLYSTAEELLGPRTFGEKLLMMGYTGASSVIFAKIGNKVSIGWPIYRVLSVEDRKTFREDNK